jgi:DNA-binding NtrC family response regulator
MDILSRDEIEVLLLDLTMPHLSGQALLPRIREAHPDLPVIVITGIGEAAVAVDCMKLGVFDYLVKAVEKSKLVATVGRAVEIRELRRENRALRDHLVDGVLEHPENFAEFVSEDERMGAVFKYVESIAGTAETVLITGETGTGKELIAGALHRASGRTGRLVTVNIAGLDETMFADTIFGHVKGAYTGADQVRRGLAESASGGTLFLDEIGDLASTSQVRLLRLLETREYYPLGSDMPRRTDARILVATNHDLAVETREGRFRKDLYYRLKIHHVHLHPLRERTGDIPLLVDHFIAQAGKDLGREISAVSRELYSRLRGYGFPGNVRELRSMIFDAVSRSAGGELSLQLFEESSGSMGTADAEESEGAILSFSEKFPTLREASGFLIKEALQRCGGNQAQAAKLLGISPQALSKRLKGSED